MSFRAVITRTVEGHVTVPLTEVRTIGGRQTVVSTIVERDGKRFYLDRDEVEELVVDRHVTLWFGETKIAEEWDARKSLTLGEAEMIERTYGGSMSTFMDQVDDSAYARKVLIWALLRRQQPEIRIGELDNASMGDWRIETRDDPVPGENPLPTEPSPVVADDQSDGSSSTGESTTSSTPPTSLASDSGSGSA